MEEMGTREEIQWYERDFTLENAMDMIRGSMKSAVRNYVAVGFYLKAIRDRKLFEEAGYRNFEEFVRDRYDKDKGWASKCIKVNDRLSKGGNSPLLAEGYKDYNVSQLVELAAMDEEQRAQVTPKTSVREMKQIRNPKLEEPKKVATLQLPDEEDGPEPDPNDEIVVDISTCPPSNNGSCRRQEWGTSPEEQAEGHKECVKCWEDWNKAEQIHRAEDRAGQETDKEDLEPESRRSAAGCGGGNNCFSCFLECNIRQEECYCVDAPLGNPFPCTTLGIIGRLRKEIGDQCQFVNHELAYHRAGDNEPVPCCKRCQNPCEYVCDKAAKVIATSQQEEPTIDALGLPVATYNCLSRAGITKVSELSAMSDNDFARIRDMDARMMREIRDKVKSFCLQEQETIDAELSEVKEPEDPPTDLQIARQELERANNLLEKCLRDLPDETNIHIRGMKIKVAALASLVCDLDDIENPPPKAEQPELPMLRNNDQRAAFVDAYETWPLWIETVETGERYYRYDLADGTSMVVKVYHAMLYDYSRTDLRWEDRYTEGYGMHEYYLLQPGKFFRDCGANRLALIEKLKEIQKKG